LKEDDMTVYEVLEQAKQLNPKERDELVWELLALQMGDTIPQSQPKTGAELVAWLNANEPIELVDADIEDPVEWVKAQRRKRDERLKPYWDGDK